MSESIWKKEITLRRKSTVAPEPKPAKESVWKKEISLGRKHASKPQTPVVDFDFPPAHDVQHIPTEALSEQAAPAPEPPTSFWRKERSLKRAPKQAEAIAEHELEESEIVDLDTFVEPPVFVQTPAPEPPTSFWRKERSLKRAPKQVEAVAEPEPAEAESVVEPPVFVQTSAPEPEVTVGPELEPVPEPELEAPVLEVPAAEPVAVVEQPEPNPAWRTAEIDEAPAEAESVVEPPVFVQAPIPAAIAWPQSVRAEPESVLAPQPVDDIEEPQLGDAWLGHAAYPEQAEPEGTSELEVAVEPEPEQTLVPKTSFLRKERSLKRARKQKKTHNGDSFLRRERSLTKPKMSVPKRASGAAGGSGGHAVKRYVGLKVGSSQIAAARVSNNGAAELLQVAREPLAHGVVVNGELRDPEALAEALKRFFARNKLPRKNVRLGIASSRIGVRVFDISGIEDDKQLENAIRFRAQDTLPIPLDEAVLDYHILGESIDEQGNPARRVLLVVAYRELVDRYVAACRKAGVSLVGIDLEAFALLRALAPPKPADQASDAAFVAVAIGHDRSTFAVSDGRVCEFTRVIEWGGASLSVAIARVLDMAPSEVEAIKRLVSLDADTVPEGIEAADYTRAVEAVHRQVQGFARELVSSLQFYQGQHGSLGIGEIVITGGTANLAGLAGELERQIGVRVRVGDPLARLKVGKKISADEQIGSLAVAIGLGIED